MQTLNKKIKTKSTVNAVYMEPSSQTIIEPNKKIGDLFHRNMTGAFVLQRLSERAYWVQSFNYGTVFYVGDQGVLIFDALEGVYDNIMQAVRSVTDKPITAVIYPHYHADHIGDIEKYVTEAKNKGIELEIIASSKTYESMKLANSAYPLPTRQLTWPRDSFVFEGQTIELHGFEWAAHTDDHSAWLLKEDRIVHSPDLFNPDQPPFYKFAGNERFRFHEDNLRQVESLQWDYLSGSHGNIGYRDDIKFQFDYIADLKQAVGQSMQEHPFTSVINPNAKAHTEFMEKWFSAVAQKASDIMKPKYGEMYGFENAILSNAELLAWTMFEIR